MKMFRFRATPEGKEVMREVREPLINDDSHYPTSIEWWAMLFESFKHIYAGGEPVYAGEDNR
jgi:hypothetical protein